MGNDTKLWLNNDWESGVRLLNPDLYYTLRYRFALQNSVTRKFNSADEAYELARQLESTEDFSLWILSIACTVDGKKHVFPVDQCLAVSGRHRYPCWSSW